jgi:hypothetical protein
MTTHARLRQRFGAVALSSRARARTEADGSASHPAKVMPEQTRYSYLRAMAGSMLVARRAGM